MSAGLSVGEYKPRHYQPCPRCHDTGRVLPATFGTNWRSPALAVTLCGCMAGGVATLTGGDTTQPGIGES